VLSGGADMLGWLMTGMGCGAIAGSLTLATLGGLRNKGYWVLATSALWGLGVALFAFTSWFYLSMIVIAFVGFMSAINMSMNRSLVQLEVEQHMRGRIMSIDLMSHGLMPLGILPIGYIAETVSVQAGLAVSGVILCITTIVLGAWMPKIRAINTGYNYP
jgi:MFS family permease